MDTLTQQERRLQDGKERIKERIRVQDMLRAQVRVLVVDDDEAIRETLRLILEEEGFCVDEAHDGKQALEQLYAATTPYVVLLDLMMPQLSGMGVLSIIADEPCLVRRHAILLVTAGSATASSFPGDLLNHLQIPLIRKPFDIDSLILTIEEAAERIAAIDSASINASMSDFYGDDDTSIAHSN